MRTNITNTDPRQGAWPCHSFRSWPLAGQLILATGLAAKTNGHSRFAQNVLLIPVSAASSWPSAEARMYWYVLCKYLAWIMK